MNGLGDPFDVGATRQTTNRRQYDAGFFDRRTHPAISAPSSVVVLSVQQPLDCATATRACSGTVANEPRIETAQYARGAVHRTVLICSLFVAEPERDPAPVGPLRCF